MNIPQMIKMKADLPDKAIDSVAAAVRTELEKAAFPVGPGDRIAVAAGSRGIANIDIIVKATIAYLKDKGARPFIIPAMGSHGGAEAEGQREVLASYGITEETAGAPVISSLDVCEIDAPGLANKVFMDRHAWESDGVILVNRIKPHTDFHGKHESGLLKMAVIGLGKHRLASEMHSYGIRGLRDMMLETARCIINSGRIMGAVAIVEDAADRSSLIEAVPADKIEETDARLLKTARENMPSLPAKDIDLLIVDEMGKDISGTCMDTNIIGRIMIYSENEPESPRIKIITCFDLTEESHGNAIGVGLADIISKRLYDKIDFRQTYENGLTSSFLERLKIPVVLDDDRAILEAGLRSSHLGPSWDNARIVRIKNTLELGEFYVSAALYEEIKDQETVHVIGGFTDILGNDGALIPF